MALQKAIDLVENSGLKILVYGEAKIGKTRLCATAATPEKTLILSAEGGLKSLDGDFLRRASAWRIDSLEDLDEAYQALKAGKDGMADFDWICLDSISEIAESCLAALMRETKDGRQAYSSLNTSMIKVIRAFRDLPHNIYFSAKRAEDSEGRFCASLPGNSLKHGLDYFFDEIFALRWVKLADGQERPMLQTRTDLFYRAGDRVGALDLYEEPDLTKIAKKLNAKMGVRT
jgi:phage nucleotide-binding protein